MKFFFELVRQSARLACLARRRFLVPERDRSFVKPDCTWVLDTAQLGTTGDMGLRKGGDSDRG